MPLDACNYVDETIPIYHVYGSFGNIGNKGAKYREYGDIRNPDVAGNEIKIIGEHDAKTTAEIHSRLKDVRHLFMMGCAYHKENMQLLGLDNLRPHLDVDGSTYGLSNAEVKRLKRDYPFMTFHLYTHNKCLEYLRDSEEFQELL
jgi:hypothetical protein